MTYLNSEPTLFKKLKSVESTRWIGFMSAKEFHPDVVPDPKDLLEDTIEELDSETRPIPLTAYIDTIELLRGKGHSWRKIADYFQSKGIDANHNEICYVAKKAAKRDPIYGEVEAIHMEVD